MKSHPLLNAASAAVLLCATAGFGQVTSYGPVKVTVNKGNDGYAESRVTIANINISSSYFVGYQNRTCFSDSGFASYITGSGPSGSVGEACFYPCSTALSSDLIAAPLDLSVGSFPSLRYAVMGSSKPFYRSKNPCSGLNLRKPLSLSGDFVKIDTFKNAGSSSSKTNVYPFITVCRGDSENALVVRVSNKYVLVKYKTYDTTFAFFNPPSPATNYTVLGGITMRWYVQNDGSLNFSSAAVKPPQASAKSAHRSPFQVALSKSLARKQGVQAYSLNGEKLSSDMLDRINGIVIYNVSEKARR